MARSISTTSGWSRFLVADYETRAEITYVSNRSGSGMDGQRLRLKFLDRPLPQSLIPEGARPLP